MQNLINDISTISTIGEDALAKLVNIAKYCICNAVDEVLLSKKDNVTSIDLGIGILSILVEDNSIKYKFIPSEELESGIRDVAIGDDNPFVIKFEKTLVNKITNLYKELL